jgi:hypothetical protein
MKALTTSLALAAVSTALVALSMAAPSIRAEPTQAAAAPRATEAAQPTGGAASFEALKKLIGGRWQAPMGGGKTIIDTFQPFAFGSAILAEEWVDGEQITSTVFYLVGSELRADHYCDYGNQPRYVALPSTDPSLIDFGFREATNLDSHPAHFHTTTWHLVDTTHMTQDWHVEGGAKGSGQIHLEFVRLTSEA